MYNISLITNNVQHMWIDLSIIVYIFFQRVRKGMICPVELYYFLETLIFQYYHYSQMVGNITCFSYASIKTMEDSDTWPNDYDWCRLKYELHRPQLEFVHS